MKKRPNIVFIQADQLAARQLHCYGGRLDSSPTLDRMAREGRRFDRAYTTAPLCLPNRATTLTGRSPAIHGLLGGSTVLLADTPTYAHVLGRAGYRVGGFGKFHREGTSGPHPRVLDDIGFHEFAIVEDDKRGPYLKWIRTEHPEYYELALGRLGKCKGFLTKEQEALRARARERVFRPLQNCMHYNHMFPSPFPAEVHDATWITNHGLRFMEEHLATRGDAPFFCQISYVDPHDPYDPPEPYSTLYSADDVPEPLPAEWMEQGPSCLNELNTLNAKVIREQNPVIFRQAAALYHGSIRFMDDQIARIIAFLEERGLAENTVVLFTTDHGDMMGDHGMMAKAMCHYDGCIRVPLLVWGADTARGPSDRLTCTLDFFATFSDLAGASREDLPPLEGKSLAAECRGGDSDDAWRDVTVQSAGSQSVVTDDGWRLTRYFEHDQGQMFNLREDPDEQRNLYEDDAHAAKRRELLERLVKIGMRPSRIPRHRNLREKPVEYLAPVK
ncbi:MAG: sulfatase family protein [Planctomycetota bacterium]|jgi:arylsulfatase A-like enzyme